jgi:hypothetical protein
MCLYYPSAFHTRVRYPAARKRSSAGGRWANKLLISIVTVGNYASKYLFYLQTL